MRSRSSGSSTMLSKRKSLWISALRRRRRAGAPRARPSRPTSRRCRRCAPARSRSVQPRDLAGDVPLAAAELGQPGTAATSTWCSVDQRVAARARTASRPRSAVSSSRAAPGAGSCRRAAPSRRTPSRSPTRPRRARPSGARTGRPAPARDWMRYSRPMSCALLAFAPGGGRRRIRSRAGVAEQVGQVGGAAGELAHLGRAVQVVDGSAARRAPAARRPPPRRRRRPRRGPAGRVPSSSRPAGHSVVEPVESRAWPPARASPRRTPPGRAASASTPRAPAGRAGSPRRRGRARRAPRRRCRPR